jgi:hypothetical protein
MYDYSYVVDLKILEKTVVGIEKLTEALEGILSKKDKIRSSSFKVLIQVSEENPEILYPKHDCGKLA